MCACGCFVLAALIAAVVYTVMHGLWLATAAILAVAAVFGWLTKKMMAERKPRT